MTEYTVFTKDRGEHLRELDVPDYSQMVLNHDPATEIFVLGKFDHTHYFDGIQVKKRPTIPLPTLSGTTVAFPSPPPGLHVRVYDVEYGGYLMGEGDITLPDPRLVLPDPGTVDLHFTADFPYYELRMTEDFPYG